MNRENLFHKSKEQDNNPIAINIRPLDPQDEPPTVKPKPEKKDGQ
ncbi:MAG: hypothetical protein PSY14_01945 [bacterium]|nr:hypothetical protein [bacterium]